MSLTLLKSLKVNSKKNAVNKFRKRRRSLPKLSSNLSRLISKKSQKLSAFKKLNSKLRLSNSHSVLPGLLLNSKYAKSRSNGRSLAKRDNSNVKLLYVFLKLYTDGRLSHNHSRNIDYSKINQTFFKLTSTLNKAGELNPSLNRVETRTIRTNSVRNYQLCLNATLLARAWSLNLYESSKTRESLSVVNYDSHVPLLLFSHVLRLRLQKRFKTSFRFIINDLNILKSQHLKATSMLTRFVSSLKKIRSNKLFSSANGRSVIIKSLQPSRKKSRRYRLIFVKRLPKKLASKSRLLSPLRKNSNYQIFKKLSTSNLNRLLSNAVRNFNVAESHSLISTDVSPSVKKLNTNVSLLSTQSSAARLISITNGLSCSSKLTANNLLPVINLISSEKGQFKPVLTRDLNFYPNVSPWILDSLIRLIENCSGKRAVIQHSMNIEHMVNTNDRISYKQLIVRMAYYERTLGHRFFMEEALHIMHLSFKYHDVKLFASWLKAIITRISFWKTRSIFRFLKYVFNNHYRYVFNSLSVKGIKIRLKGKISAAGNSRKRTILFRSGKNSYSSVNIKCVHNFATITTFTGVLGFQVWLFY